MPDPAGDDPGPRPRQPQGVACRLSPVPRRLQAILRHVCPRHLASPPRGRGRRGLPLPGPGRFRRRILRRADVYRQLAEVEDRHVQVWLRLLAEHGHEATAPVPSGRARFMAWLGRRIGPGFLLPALLEEEGKEVKGYLQLHRESTGGAADAALLLAARIEAARRPAGRSCRPPRASPGTRPGPAASSGMWSTDSTTDSRPTSASSRAWSARRPVLVGGQSRGGHRGPRRDGGRCALDGLLRLSRRQERA